MTSLSLKLTRGGREFTIILPEVSFSPSTLAKLSASLSALSGTPLDPFVATINTFLDDDSPLPCLARGDPCTCESGLPLASSGGSSSVEKVSFIHCMSFSMSNCGT